ncbi:MAG TPA: hypothetical protein VF468_14640 [Actinomycetota bacterium]|nr:hypothetical protein [Actinomycetota bacterium]
MNPTTGAATGHCPVCGQTFTPAPGQIPRRRYCSERCRKTAWRRRRPGRRRADAVPPAVPPAVPRPDAVAARAQPAARCPHCARPVAVITLRVTPAAAQVPIPGARHD